MGRKAKRYEGRVYLGQDQDGKQLWHWVGRSNASGTATTLSRRPAPRSLG